jgi:hypothetical protein
MPVEPQQHPIFARFDHLGATLTRLRRELADVTRAAAMVDADEWDDIRPIAPRWMFALAERAAKRLVQIMPHSPFISATDTRIVFQWPIARINYRIIAVREDEARFEIAQFDHAISASAPPAVTAFIDMDESLDVLAKKLVC